MAEKAVGALNNGGYSVQATSLSWGFWRIRSTRCSTGTQDDQHDVQGALNAGVRDVRLAHDTAKVLSGVDQRHR